MKILLVNDDGFGAPGIESLLKACARRGHETVLVAPKEQQSAMSHRFTLNRPLLLQEKPCAYPGCRTYALEGSPADCVRIGVHHLCNGKPDVLLSGINKGTNSGTAVYYSGTFSAAMEGAFLYVPSIAVSIHQDAPLECVDALAEYAVNEAEKAAVTGFPRSTVLNLNAPAVPWIGEKSCPLDGAYFTDSYQRRENPWGGSYFWMLPGDNVLEPADPGSDNDYLSRGYLTRSLVGGFHALKEENFPGQGQ